MEEIPTDNHIRSMLDPVEPDGLFGLFGETVDVVAEGGGLEGFHRLGGRVLIAFDGTEYFRSKKIHCPKCSRRRLSGGGMEYFHSFLSAAQVAPGHNRVIPLEPEFIVAREGASKQDCESRAARRWLKRFSKRHAALDPIYLGDDLYSCQPVCQAVLDSHGHFLFVAKPSSHPTLWEWLSGIELPRLEVRVKKAGRFVTHRYQWLEGVPLRDSADALTVNWLQIEIVNGNGKITYRNSFVTDLPVSAENVAELAACGRARWKIENETFNVLKTKGYHLEHNFGHGKKNLSILLVTMNLLAFAFHTVCDLLEVGWRQARDAVGPRYRFFEHMRTVTAYHVFDDWNALVTTLRTGTPPARASP